MAAWFSANWINVVLVLTLALITGGIVVAVIRSKKAGKCACGCDCAACGACSACKKAGRAVNREFAAETCAGKRKNGKKD